MIKNYLIFLVFLCLTFVACENQSSMEKIEASKNDLMRSAKKTKNRLEEAACEDSDLKCLAEKAKNRTEESYDEIIDKSKEVVDEIDE